MEGDLFGAVLSRAGDINGDGYDDLTVGAALWSEDGSESNGAAYVYYGSVVGLTAESEQKIRPPPPTSVESFGFGSGGGDINGDGYDDLLLYTLQLTADCPGQGGIYVYYGSPNGLDETNIQALTGSDAECGLLLGSYFGSSQEIIPDLNGDGFDEVLIGATNITANRGAAYFYYGSASGLDTASEQKFASPSEHYFGGNVSDLGDVNGDGWRDLGVSALGTAEYGYPSGEVFVYLGTADGPTFDDPLTLRASDATYTTAYGRDFIGVGDLNGDGYDEILVGAHEGGNSTRPGTAYLYYGSAAGPDPASEQKLLAFDGPDTGGGFGYGLELVGDLDGDGVPEFIVTAAYMDEQIEGEDGLNIGAAYRHSLRRDADGDGIDAGQDCDDANASVGEAPPRYRDFDGDGFTSIGSWSGLCVDVPGFSLTSTGDCDDVRPESYPGAADVCEDGLDTNCDGWGDTEDDEDGDGLSWRDEALDDIDPCDPDTDDDGLLDGEDPTPLGEGDTAPPDTDLPDTNSPDDTDEPADSGDGPAEEPRPRVEDGCAGCGGGADGLNGGAALAAALAGLQRRRRVRECPAGLTPGGGG